MLLSFITILSLKMKDGVLRFLSKRILLEMESKKTGKGYLSYSC